MEGYCVVADQLPKTVRGSSRPFGWIFAVGEGSFGGFVRVARCGWRRAGEKHGGEKTPGEAVSQFRAVGTRGQILAEVGYFSASRSAGRGWDEACDGWRSTAVASDEKAAANRR